MAAVKSEPGWHINTIADVFERLDSGRQGLAAKEAKARLKKFGPNALPEAKLTSVFAVFLRQFHSILIYIILAALAISLYLEHLEDAIFIAVVLVINAVVGTFQEYRAEKTLVFLKRAVELRTRVLRDGHEAEMHAAELVPGDVVTLTAGDKVPADARLIEAVGLEVNEAALTGESLAVLKDPAAVLAPDAPLAERLTMVFAGTLVDSGKATAVIVATGLKTEIGKIAQLLRETEKPVTPLQRKLARASRLIGFFILAAVGIIVAIGAARGELFAEIFVVGLALAVSAIPESLPIVITVILAVGTRRLLAQKALAKKLIVAETLGSTTVIATDKTGTLTYGDMQVSHILTGGRDLLFDGKKKLDEKMDGNGAESHITALKIALLTTAAYVENPEEELENWVVRGRPTERALFLAALQAGLEKGKMEKELPLIKELPFDPTLKVSGSLRQVNERTAVLYVVGAPETIIQDSAFIGLDGEHESMDSEIFRALQKRSEALAQKGLRILACAYRHYALSDTEDKPIPDLMKKLTFIGFIAIRDPVRKEAKEALRLTEDAGIKTIIVTGDHKYTALAIAEEVGMTIDPKEVMEGREVESLPQEALQERAKTIRLYARVSPHHKIRIVEVLRANGEVVAMVGDGVNDAPSLHGADIGVAVGSGTEIAKEASDMVILDGNFHTLVRAVEQGRLIFENIRKVIIYLLADDFSGVFVIGFAIIFALPLPLLPAQILFINIIEDTLPAAALVFSKEKTETLMKHKPRGLRDPIFGRPFLKWLVAIFFIGGPALLTFFPILAYTGDIDFARTFIFATTAFDSLVFAFVVNSLHETAFRKDIFENRYLVGAVGIGIAMILGAVYLPPLQAVLRTVALSPLHWLAVLGVSGLELLLLEFTKYRFLRRVPQHHA